MPGIADNFADILRPVSHWEAGRFVVVSLTLP
jgi:hypothetical protein